MNNDLKRYERQIPIIGEEGQEKLKNTKVLVAGAGGLGSCVLTHLVSAGIGTIGIVDHDVVELSNLNRQSLYGYHDIGKSKVEVARERLRDINPDAEIKILSETITGSNASELVSSFDMIVDALDNYPARYVLNRAAVVMSIPVFHGAVHGFYGQAITIIPGKTACLRCIVPSAPPTASPPIIGACCGMIGSIQAMEVVRYIVGKGELLENRLLMLDGLDMIVEEVPVERNPECEDCATASKRL